MKYFKQFLIASFMVLLLANCANGKKIQEEPPVPLQQAYYTTWTVAEDGANSGITLFIPGVNEMDIQLDSVYFRGRRAGLVRSGANTDVYLAFFEFSDQEESDIIMHADPKKEYGNKAPVIPKGIPFELEEHEAVVRYEVNGKEKYFKLTGIQERETSDTEIKRPENIRH